jgi:hypothetical protein
MTVHNTYISNYHRIYQLFFISRPPQNLPKLGFGFENPIPSGNPAENKRKHMLCNQQRLSKAISNILGTTVGMFSQNGEL